MREAALTMCLDRLVKAVKENRDALKAIHDATFTGNYTPPKSLSHGSPLVQRLQASYRELEASLEESEDALGLKS